LNGRPGGNVQGSHQPVLAREVIGYLAPAPGETFVDATVGGAGHAIEIAKRIGRDGRLIGIDRDEPAVEQAKIKLQNCECSASIVRGNFENLRGILEKLNVALIDGLLLDLGVSSMQLETGERGFSFLHDGPLDMRMDMEIGQPAGHYLKHLSEKSLTSILQEYGEERHARKIARAIVEARRRQPLATTSNLVNVILRAVPRRPGRIHPATRVFQALRILVNRELECLQNVLKDVERVMRPGARIAVISFHSLEDRIVKNAFRDKATAGVFEILTRKPVTASDEEMRDNPRSRSAKLRAAKKI
jgi:16S rRNA (cytosine1402-N4)-methyltransferase